MGAGWGIRPHHKYLKERPLPTSNGPLGRPGLEKRISDQRRARARLFELYDASGGPENQRRSWQKVGDQIGENRGRVWNIAHGKQRATAKILQKLGFVRNRRKPWKKKYHLLRRGIYRKLSTAPVDKSVKSVDNPAQS
jgi:hypothetical protein